MFSLLINNKYSEGFSVKWQNTGFRFSFDVHGNLFLLPFVVKPHKQTLMCTAHSIKQSVKQNCHQIKDINWSK